MISTRMSCCPKSTCPRCRLSFRYAISDFLRSSKDRSCRDSSTSLLLSLKKMSKSKILKSPERIKDILLITSIILILFLLHHHHEYPNNLVTSTTTTSSSSTTTTTPTTVRHVLFSIAASSTFLPNRTPYLRLWYSPTTTRAFIFLDRPTPNLNPNLPPIVISAPTSSFPYTFPSGLRSAIRVARIVKEAVDVNLNHSDIRWFVFGDDDTVFIVDNLVKTLSKYDHEKWHYIGSNSESYEQNDKYSFDMGFGGGGFAISSSLARVLARVLDNCLMRYPHLYGSDSRIFSCLVELGVELTHEPGFHQVDVRGDLFGMLSSHPLSPLLSLHHFDAVEPIFPGMTRSQALEHLFKAVNVDPARILQQTVCHNHSNSFTLSIAWGYAVQVLEGNRLLPDLLPLQRSFRPWKRSRDISSSRYMFNTREYPKDPCKRPIVFFLKNIARATDGIYTEYIKDDIGNCPKTKAIQNLEYIRVFSHKQYLDVDRMKAPRRQCCDILSSSSKTLYVGIRECGSDELISMQNYS